MLNLKQIKDQYPDRLHTRPKFLLREYLQYKILEALSQQKQGKDLVFMGGTAIRLVYQSQRFSEDLDFDNRGLKPDQYQQLMTTIKRQLELEGLLVEIKLRFKAAYHCYFKFSGLLQQFDLTKQKKEKIMIRFDAADQGYDYQHDLKLLNKFDVFARVPVVPVDLLLAQKILAALQRERAKGRDFYDIVFLKAQAEPDMIYLKQKADISSQKELKQALLDRSQSVNFEQLAQELRPFLMSAQDQERVLHFKQFVQQSF
jgi:predicted nucleotidyltransferase component of viral defense system